jgi:hypothetical protein
MVFEILPALTAGLTTIISVGIALIILKVLKVPHGGFPWYALFFIVIFCLQYPVDIYLKPLIHQQLAEHIVK